MANSSISTFIGMMDQFLEELCETFKEETRKIKGYLVTYESLKKNNPKKVLEIFLSEVGPYITDITNKNEKLIMDNEIEIVKKLNLKTIWTSPNATSNTKECIWAHLNTLYIFGVTINQIPDSLMKGIEDLAHQYVENPEQGNDLQNIDTASLMKGLQNLMGSKVNN